MEGYRVDIVLIRFPQVPPSMHQTVDEDENDPRLTRIECRSNEVRALSGQHYA